MQLNGNRQFIIPIDMKKTIHVNIGGMPFVLDEDAYDVLKRYLSEIEIRLDGVDDQETMQDIETRIADIFSGAISPRMQVVDTALVKRAMAVIGPAQEFGEPRRSMPGREQTCVRNDEKHLYRSRRDRVVDARVLSELVHARGGNGPVHVHDNEGCRGSPLLLRRARMGRVAADRLPGMAERIAPATPRMASSATSRAVAAFPPVNPYLLAMRLRRTPSPGARPS